MHQKKWTSFEEMYLDLREDPEFASSVRDSLAKDIQEVVKSIELAQTSRDFFNSTCKLSAIFDSLGEDSLQKLYTENNTYTLVLNAALRNKKLIEILLNVLKKNQKISELKKNGDLETLIFLNTAISLAFFGIAINYQSINNTSVEFLRRNTTDLLKNILWEQKEINFVHLCSFLERIAWDKSLHYKATFPVKLKSDFLFENLKLSRSFGGIIFTSLLIRPTVEQKFKKTIASFGREDFSITFALNSIFTTANDLEEKIKHYYRTAPRQDITTFFDTFINKNEKNIIFCLTKFCSNFHFQGTEVGFFNVVLNKLEEAASLKEKFVLYTKREFSAFNKEVLPEDGEWTNKLFIISIKTLSVLKEVKIAHDSKWKVSVAVYELRQWILEIHEVLNKYYIEDDWEKIKDVLIREDEQVEWKSSFFTPLEQEFEDELTETTISKRIFEKIQKVILAMLNTDGGILVVGIVENPEAIKRPEVREFLMKKNHITFFDINAELRKAGKTLDHLRLQILEALGKTTDRTTDHFNGLVEFEPIILRDSERSISIIKISITKAERPFFNVRKENGIVWLSLTKRAQGQNIDVDIREHMP